MSHLSSSVIRLLTIQKLKCFQIAAKIIRTIRVISFCGINCIEGKAVNPQRPNLIAHQKYKGIANLIAPLSLSLLRLNSQWVSLLGWDVEGHITFHAAGSQLNLKPQGMQWTSSTFLQSYFSTININFSCTDKKSLFYYYSFQRGIRNGFYFILFFFQYNYILSLGIYEIKS